MLMLFALCGAIAAALALAGAVPASLLLHYLAIAFSSSLFFAYFRLLTRLSG